MLDCGVALNSTVSAGKRWLPAIGVLGTSYLCITRCSLQAAINCIAVHWIVSGLRLVEGSSPTDIHAVTFAVRRTLPPSKVAHSLASVSSLALRWGHTPHRFLRGRFQEGHRDLAVLKG